MSDGHGGTRLAMLHGESPLLVRRTGVRTVQRTLTVHLVGGAAGPLRGDDLRLEVVVGAGAALEVRSVAAQLALPGTAGLPPSRLEVHATVAAGGTLRWLPEPLIAAAGCDHRTVTRVEVAESGTLLWRDDLVCGRHDERCGSVVTDTHIRYAGKTLYRHDLSVGPDAPGWSGAAVLGDGRAVGTLVAVPNMAALSAAPTKTALSAASTMTALSAASTMTALSAAPIMAAAPTKTAADPPRPLGPDAAIMPLAGPGTLATVVGADIRQVRAVLDPLCEPPGPGDEPTAPAAAEMTEPATPALETSGTASST